MTISVLIIDNDLVLLESVTGSLLTDDFTIIISNQVPGSIDLVKLLLPDIVILDLSHPDLNGLDVCRQIRQFSKVPILVLSATNSSSEVTRILDCGADDLISKPVNSQVFSAQINNLVRRTKIATTGGISANLLPL